MVAGSVPRPGIPGDRAADGRRILGAATPERVGDAPGRLPRGEGGDELLGGYCVLGSVLGALANYGLAHWLGRPFLRRLGRYLWISDKSLERSERYFADHGEISTFMARMLPVVRHLISLPAGLARMNLAKFVTFTGLGALVWCTILTWIGWFIC